MSVMSPAAFRQSRVDYTLYIQNIQLSTQTNVIKKPLITDFIQIELLETVYTYRRYSSTL